MEHTELKNTENTENTENTGNAGNTENPAGNANTANGGATSGPQRSRGGRQRRAFGVWLASLRDYLSDRFSLEDDDKAQRDEVVANIAKGLSHAKFRNSQFLRRPAGKEIRPGLAAPSAAAKDRRLGGKHCPVRPRGAKGGGWPGTWLTFR